LDELDRLAKIAVDSGFHLHKEIGPGLLESVYEIILAEELQQRGLSVKRQVPVTLRYKGVVVDNAYKADILIETQISGTQRPGPCQASAHLLAVDEPAARAPHELRLGNLQRWGPADRQSLRRIRMIGETFWPLRVLA
jgi:hypothetical protein